MDGEIITFMREASPCSLNYTRFPINALQNILKPIGSTVRYFILPIGLNDTLEHNGFKTNQNVEIGSVEMHLSKCSHFWTVNNLFNLRNFKDVFGYLKMIFQMSVDTHH